MEFNLHDAPPGIDGIERECEAAWAGLAETKRRIKRFGGSLIIISLLLGMGVLGLWLSGAMAGMAEEMTDYNIVAGTVVVACVCLSVLLALLTLEGIRYTPVNSPIFVLCIIFTFLAIFGVFTAVGAATIIAFFAAFTAAIAVIFAAMHLDNYKTQCRRYFATLYALTPCTEEDRNRLNEISGNETIARYLAQLDNQGRDPVAGEYEMIMAS